MFKFVTFNQRCFFQHYDCDGINHFFNRFGLILNTIDKNQPDVICFQEVTDEAYPLFKRHMPEYDLYWRGRNNDFNGEGLMIATKKDTVQLLDTETFWLSDTPYIAGSRYEQQSQCPRITVMALLRHLTTNKLYRIYDTHLDHQAEYARVEGIKLTLKHIKDDIKKLPASVILAGDLNAEPTSKPIQIINNAKTPALNDVTKKFDLTYHNFGKIDKDSKIDYIFVDDALAKSVKACFLWEECNKGIYLSDHFPVECDFE